jgi:hypothetical protein
MQRPLCVFHGSCADGFGAAWVVRKFFNGECDFHPGVYQDPPPDVNGRIVILVDFSYKRDVLLELAKNAWGVLLIDHHKSAAEDLKADDNYIVDFGGYSGRKDWRRFLECSQMDRWENAQYARVYSVFDMQRSGAGMAWDFFFPDDHRPALIDRIEDRDLWRFSMPDTRAVQAAVFSYPYDFGVWDALANADMAKLRTEGEAIERKHHKDIAELVKSLRREMIIGGHWVPVANLPYTLTSDAGHLMCQPYQSLNLQGEIVTPPFAGCYWDTPSGRVFSLRSVDGGADVSEIAKQYGGGGHKNASGFRVPLAELAERGLL